MTTDLNDRMNQKSEELKQKEQDEIASREDRLLTAATVTRSALFDAYEAVTLDDANSVDGTIGKFEQCTALLKGRPVASTTAPVQPTAAAAESPASLPFDFDSLPADTQRIMMMIAQEPRRFKEEALGEQVVLKDTRYASARAALRRKQDEERAQEEVGDGSSSTPAPPAPAKKTAAKKAAPAPPRSGATATEVQPPAAAEAPAVQAEASASDEASESPSQPKPSAMDRVKAAAKTGAAKLVEPTPKK